MRVVVLGMTIFLIVCVNTFKIGLYEKNRVSSPVIIYESFACLLLALFFFVF